jgi:phage terminase large subunit GpA-like protein
MSEALRARLFKSRRQVLKPKPKMNLVEWADTYRYLSSESSALPGRWRTDRVEPARGVMLAATDPMVNQITVMSCSQLLKSEFLNNVVAYYMVNDPCPILMMHPTVSMAESYSKDRLDPMIRDTPAVREVVSGKKGRDSKNTVARKSFYGGQITLVGSNAPAELASRPIRIVLCDEVDRYGISAGVEGDPVSLVAERSATFAPFNKLICTSTPTIEGRSRIEQLYLAGDRRVYVVPCPSCGITEELKFENVKWTDDDPETAAYHCPGCSHVWSESERKRAISRGFYQATAPFKGHASFKVTKLASPWESLSVLVKKFLEAKGNPELLKTFLNTQLAETWVEKGEAPDSQRLYERREPYELNTLPKGVVFLTAGVDVQKDRLEVEIVGYGRDKQSWSIDYRVIMGDTATPKPWSELDKILNESWLTENERSLQIRLMAVDTGYNTQHVYNWLRTKSADRVRGIKGSDGLQTVFGTPKDVDVAKDGSKLRRALKLWTIGVSVLKSELYGWLKMDKPEDGKEFPPGYCHFPMYDLEHFKRLTAEQLMKKTLKGQTHYQWVKTFERNEQLDCRIYARAAASMFGIDRFTDKEFDILEGIDESLKPPPTGRSELLGHGLPKSAPDPQPRKKDVQASDYWSRQKKKFW